MSKSLKNHKSQSTNEDKKYLMSSQICKHPTTVGYTIQYNTIMGFIERYLRSVQER